MSLLSALWSAHGSLRELPVVEVLPHLASQLERARELSVLQAPPGSGKTLLAPLWLLENCGYRRVFVLVPRRVNARLPVLFLESSCGAAVGYRIRFESRWNEQAVKVGYLTYGTALRSFVERPPCPDDLVIFDEFHERPWEADLLLAHLRAARQSGDGPRLLLMSATLELTSMPQDTPVTSSDGRLHPVEIAYEKVEPQLLARPERLPELVARRSAELAGRGGEQLIFLPGIAPIRAVESALRADPVTGPIDILHSSLGEDQIRRVVERPAEAGFRRILATDLAESSVTLPGVTTVIDAGLQRRPRRDAFGLGVTLETVRAPLSSLIQRSGRAGRLRPGYCHRLLTREDELRRHGFGRPQLFEVDGKVLALHLAALRRLQGWQQLPWLVAPAAPEVERGSAWLERHRLTCPSAHLSPAGVALLGSTCSPRVGLFALAARQAGWPLAKVVDWAYALESGPDFARAEALTLSELLANTTWSRQRDPKLLQRLRDTLAGLPPRQSDQPGHPLLQAFEETLVELRGDRALPRDAKAEALLYRSQHRPASRYAVVLATAPTGREGPVSSVRLYQEVTDDELWEALLDEMVENATLFWDEKTRSIRQARRTSLGALVVEETLVTPPPGPAVASLLRERLTPADLGEKFTQLLRRLTLFLETQPEFLEQLDPSLAGVKEPVKRLLDDYLETVTGWSKSAPEELRQYVEQRLGYRALKELESSLPSTVRLPGRQRPVPVTYPEHGLPYVASKLQDFFGWTPPRLLDGRLGLLCHLLAPSGRPVQITDDLQRFWTGSYQQVRKDLRGRYPKHAWPQTP